jgi:hypothetical protein
MQGAFLNLNSLIAMHMHPLFINTCPVKLYLANGVNLTSYGQDSIPGLELKGLDTGRTATAVVSPFKRDFKMRFLFRVLLELL